MQTTGIIDRLQSVVANWPDHWTRDSRDLPTFKSWLEFMRSNDYAPEEFLDALEAALLPREGSSDPQ